MKIKVLMVAVWMFLLFGNNLFNFNKAEATEIKKVVTIDPGHGTKYSRSGAEGEKKYAMILSVLIKEKLEKSGVTVFMTHEKYDCSEFMGENYNEDNINRALFANNKNSDLYFRVHFDAGNGRAAIYYPERHSNREVAEKSKEASLIIFKNILDVIKESGEKYSNSVLTDNDTQVGMENKGLLTGSMYSQKTTVLLETLPLNKKAAEWIEKKENQEKYAEAIKNGIVEYLNR